MARHKEQEDKSFGKRNVAALKQYREGETCSVCCMQRASAQCCFCRILEQNKWCNGERRISSQRLVAPALCSSCCMLCLQTAGSTWPTDLTGCGTCCRWPGTGTTSGDTVDSSRYPHQECVDMFCFQRTWLLSITWCRPWVRSPAVEGVAVDIYQVISI